LLKSSCIVCWSTFSRPWSIQRDEKSIRKHIMHWPKNSKWQAVMLLSIRTKYSSWDYNKPLREQFSRLSNNLTPLTLFFRVSTILIDQKKKNKQC
jgi:hypothetical protein